ncbi:MAG: hypothetical protein KIT58_06660 [Planctomycetota bacterium]|nr:hypothetical protein [Planctomycetota bacterium]
MIGSGLVGVISMRASLLAYVSAAVLAGFVAGCGGSSGGGGGGFPGFVDTSGVAGSFSPASGALTESGSGTITLTGGSAAVNGTGELTVNAAGNTTAAGKTNPLTITGTVTISQAQTAANQGGTTFRGSGTIETRDTSNPTQTTSHTLSNVTLTVDTAGRLTLDLGSSGTLTGSLTADGPVPTSGGVPVPGPPARTLHGLAFDSARNEVVLFGGRSSASGALGDTWIWNGTRWIQRSPTTSPPARSDHGMTFDSQRGVVIVYGGTSSTGAQLGDTWEWNGTNWSQQSPTASPPARTGVRLAFDSGRNRTVLFGGGIPATSNDVWEFNGVTWANVTPPPANPSPVGRASHSFEFAGSRSVLVAGKSGGTSELKDIWAFNGTAWENVNTTGFERHKHATAFDQARQRLVIFGGRRGSATLTETEIANPTALNFASAFGGGSGIEPPAREDHAMAYDAPRQRVVLFGGYPGTGTENLGDTWVWDGSAWSRR